MSVDILIAPLRALVDAMGTGDIPAAATTALRQSGIDLEQAAKVSERSVSGPGWQGAGAQAAEQRTRALATIDRTIGAEGGDVARLVEGAAGHVRTANSRLNALVDSFVRVAASLPAAMTPAGLAALIPIALDHLARGLVIVRQAHAALGSDTAALSRYRDSVTTLASGGPSRPGPRTGPPAGGLGGEGTQIVLPDGSVVTAPNERAATAVRAALSVQGTPYVWGGTTTDGFDCSGFTQWAYRQAGLELPRLAQDQDTVGFAVSQSELAPGDLAVWSGHVAMYIGNNQFVETGGDPVGVTPVRTSNAGQTFEGFYRPR